MEKGSLRCDANVSVRRVGTSEFGTKTELKNMNSFKFLGEGMAAEIDRQIELLEDGGTVRQETLHYDPADRSLHARRSKEEADDYRYFPEPDLVPAAADSRGDREPQRSSLPELPAARQARFQCAVWAVGAGCGRPQRRAAGIADYFEHVVAAGAEPKAASDWVRNQPAVVRRDRRPKSVAALLELIAKGTITSTIAKQVLRADAGRPDPPIRPPSSRLTAWRAIGGGDELAALVDEVMAEQPGSSSSSSARARRA